MGKGERNLSHGLGAVLRPHLAALEGADRTKQRVAMEAVCTEFGRVFVNQRGELADLQRTVIEMGLGEAVCALDVLGVEANVEEYDAECQEWVCHCLKWLVLDNSNACAWLYRKTAIVDALAVYVNEAAEHAHFQDRCFLSRNEAVLRLINTLARSLWGTHEHMCAVFLPALTRIVADPDMPAALRAQCVNNAVILSCNPQVVERMEGMVEALGAIASEQDASLNSIGAMLAVGNITCTGIADDMAPAPVTRFDPWATHALMLALKDVVSRTLRSLDYPANSRRYYTAWMLTLGVSNVCKSKKGSEHLGQNGMVRLLQTARKHDDPRVRFHADKALRCLAVANPRRLLWGRARVEKTPSENSDPSGSRGVAALRAFMRRPSSSFSSRKHWGQLGEGLDDQPHSEGHDDGDYFDQSLSGGDNEERDELFFDVPVNKRSPKGGIDDVRVV